jgi:hypothetical protein
LLRDWIYRGKTGDASARDSKGASQVEQEFMPAAVSHKGGIVNRIVDRPIE